LRLHPLLWLLLLASLVACSATPPLEAVRATPDGVTFAYGEGRAGDAARQASLYCANLGRSAQLREVAQDGGADLLAVFDCR